MGVSVRSMRLNAGAPILLPRATTLTRFPALSHLLRSTIYSTSLHLYDRLLFSNRTELERLARDVVQQ
jgi:hypothetical protein